MNITIKLDEAAAWTAVVLGVITISIAIVISITSIELAHIRAGNEQQVIQVYGATPRTIWTKTDIPVEVR